MFLYYEFSIKNDDIKLLFPFFSKNHARALTIQTSLDFEQCAKK